MVYRSRCLLCIQIHIDVHKASGPLLHVMIAFDSLERFPLIIRYIVSHDSLTVLYCGKTTIFSSTVQGFPLYRT